MKRVIILFSLGVLATSMISMPARAAPTCLGEPATIFESGEDETSDRRNGYETVRGSRGADVIAVDPAEPVSYRILGMGGADVICSAHSYDVIRGGPGDDRMLGRGSVARLYGGSGDDVLLAPGRGDNQLQGEGGNDTLVSLFGHSSLNGGPGRDLLRGGPRGSDNIDGGRGGDHLVDGRRLDFLRGGAGNDIIRGRGGGDQFRGGTGNHRLLGGPGRDEVGFRGSNLVSLRSHTARGRFTDTFSGFEFVYARSDRPCRLIGDERGNFLVAAGAGDHVVLGRGGSDELGEGQGDDTPQGWWRRRQLLPRVQGE